MTKLHEVQTEITRLRNELSANQRARQALEEQWAAAWKELGDLCRDDTSSLPWQGLQATAPTEQTTQAPVLNVPEVQQPASSPVPTLGSGQQAPVGQKPPVVRAVEQPVEKPDNTSNIGKSQIVVNFLTTVFQNVDAPEGLSVAQIYQQLKNNRAFFEADISYPMAISRLTATLYNLYRNGVIDRHERDPKKGLPYRYFPS